MLITLSEKIKMLKITVTMHVCFHLPKKNLAEYILNHQHWLLLEGGVWWDGELLYVFLHFNKYPKYELLSPFFLIFKVKLI